MLPDALFWKVHMYGIMVALGVLAAFGVLYLYSKKMKIDLSFTDFLFYDGIVSVLLGFGCAALFQGVYNYIENPAAGFSLKGGITFLGGMLGGAAVFIGVYLLLRRRLKGRLVSTEYGFPALSVLPCCVLIGHSLGRVGCSGSSSVTTWPYTLSAAEVSASSLNSSAVTTGASCSDFSHPPSSGRWAW